MALKVIGAGLGRTGTHSLKLALEELGFGKCYHMEELVAHNPQNVAYWQKAKRGEPVNWDELFTGFQSAVDIPTFCFYKELMAKYPAARVILTIRNFDSWYKSFEDTIIRQSRPSFGQIVKMSFKLPFDKKVRQRLKVFQFAGEYLKEWFPNGFKDKDSVKKFYDNWNEDVKKMVPAEKLLVYEIKQGWQPLSNFLGVPVPATPFPHSNTTHEFNTRKL